ncbi:MAG TPA: YggS family pyridoxal phosphate-dependent enzyme, partial [Feifaniaceae bacterium]|nr:YggS family pyridoxal phosphate-dependent enzyme [Feifaniaceae bacterium]
MGIRENYEQIREQIASACASSGRNPEEVTLVAVTKFVPVERIAVALDLGITRVGENRAQELTEKLDFFTERKCDIHFIGQLQT